MFIDDFLKWVNGNGVVVGILTFLLGTLFGHWLAIHRDDRKRRADTFDAIRVKLLSAPMPVRIGPADVDAVLTVCTGRRRKALLRAIKQCNQAANDYYVDVAKDGFGHSVPSPEHQAAMHAALLPVIQHLRHV